MTIINSPDDGLSVKNRFFRYFSVFLPVNLLAHVASSVKPFLNERAQKTTLEKTKKFCWEELGDGF